jgi:RecA/RadA recombinase
MSLLDKLKKNSTIKDTAIVADSKFFNKKDMISTSVPAINIALSGKIDGGLTPGLTMWAGPSKHFKTMFSLIMAKSYMDKYDDAVMLFYDSEFGTPKAYFESLGIDTQRIIHTPLLDVEQLKFDIMQQITNLARGDHVIIVIDSIGNLASKKEVEDALDGSSKADMSRAKQLKSLFRMVTPHLTLKDIPMVVVNHTYKTMEMYAKDVVGGGTGSYYSADNIFILGRQQEKDKDKELSGYNFIINVEKSRYVREKSKIPITVSFEGGLSKWSGLLEMALESGHVIKPKNAKYQKTDAETGEVIEQNKIYSEEETNTKDFWTSILSSKSFNKFVENTYCISHGAIISAEDNVAEVYGGLDED